MPHILFAFNKDEDIFYKNIGRYFDKNINKEIYKIRVLKIILIMIKIYLSCPLRLAQVVEP